MKNPSTTSDKKKVTTKVIAANAIVDEIASIPIRQAIGAADVAFFKNKRSSVSVLGTTFRCILAEAYKKTVAHAEEAEFGFDYLESNMTRPAPGAVSTLSEDDVDEMMEVLTNLGIIRYEVATPVDYSYKFMEFIDEDQLFPASVECETSLDPVSGMAKLVHRIVVMDFLFTDKKGKNLNLTKLPQKIMEGILNALDPAMYAKAYNQQQLDALFEQAGKYGPTFRTFFNAAAAKWETIKIPKTLQTLVAFLKQGLLHEANHGLVLHLPEPDLIPAGTVSDEILEGYKKISVKAYLTLLNTHLTQFPEWQTSAVFIKNLFKAMAETKKMSERRPDWGPKEKANFFLAHLITEMFNDRFEIFELETSAKMEAYRKALNLSYNIPIGMLRDLEKEMKKALSGDEGKKAFLSSHSLTNEQFGVLQSDLNASEKTSVYIQTYGDPALSESERVFYNLFLDHLLKLEKEKYISFFKREHTGGLLFQIMKAEIIASGKIGASEIIQQSQQLAIY
jgi:hypothetical protein